MSENSKRRIPSFGGVCTVTEAHRPGFGVAEAAHRLRRVAYVKQRLVHIAATHLNAAPEWEVKSALALHAWLDAEHASTLRKRVLELRETPARLDECPDPALAAALDEVAESGSSLELLTAVYAVLRPALLEAIETYLAETNPLADHPSCRALKIVIREELDIIEWGRAALEALTDSPAARARSEEWATHVSASLAAAGRIAGSGVPPAKKSLPRRRAHALRPPEFLPTRDARFAGLFDTSTPADTVYLDDSRPAAERNLALMFKRLREMDVPEVLAGILAQTPDKPWEYYAEMSRQMWDEARHALLGQAALSRRLPAGEVDWTRLPVNVTFSWKLAKYCKPLERHILLYAIEQSLMPARRGKRYEWELARAAGDALMDLFQDFDWADEVLHVAIARRQLKSSLRGGLSEARRRSDRLWRRIAQQLEKTPMPADALAPDWWESFVEQALGTRPARVAATHVKDWRPLSA